MSNKSSRKGLLGEAIVASGELLRMLWTFLIARPKEWWQVVRPARAPYWFSMAFFLFVVINDQAADVLAAVASESPLTSLRNYMLALGLLAFSATVWYWARAVLYVWYEFSPGFLPPESAEEDRGRLYAIARTLALVQPSRESAPEGESEANRKAREERERESWKTAAKWEPTRRWVARWIGLLPVSGMAVTMGFLGHWGYVAFYVVLFVVFLAFMVWRRSLALKRLMNRDKPREEWQVIEARLHPSLPSKTLLTLGIWLFAFAVVLGLCIVSEVAFPQFMGPLGILLLTASPLIAVFTFLAYLKDRNMHWLSPTFLVLLAAVIVGLWNDNHAVRVLQEGDFHDVHPDLNKDAIKSWRADQRIDIATHFTNWLQHRSPAAEGANSVLTSDYPVFVVAAEGGGIRAAYWTAAVLSELQKASGGTFACHLFAVSGVSGGSLGGAAFVAELANAAGAKELSCTPRGESHSKGPWDGAALEFLGRDFLSPAIAGMMTSDLLSRINPLCIPSLGLTRACLPDRAAYLEHAWEAEWDALERSGFSMPVFRFSSPFHALWTAPQGEIAPRPDLPSLFLNGTWVGNGSRNLTSNLKTDVGSGRLVDAEDVLGWLQQPIRLSTAVLNSARFTYVSPPGTVQGNGRTRRIVDGGYFENSGALTARQIINAIHTACPEGLLCEGRRIRPIALIVTNNPKRPLQAWQVGGEQVCIGSESNGSNDNDAKGDSSLSFLAEIWSPIDTMFNSREARGRLAEKELGETNGAEATFRIALRSAKGVELPLGWVLSYEAQTEMREQAAAAVSSCSPRLALR